MRLKEVLTLNREFFITTPPIRGRLQSSSAGILNLVKEPNTGYVIPALETSLFYECDRIGHGARSSMASCGGSSDPTGVVKPKAECGLFSSTTEPVTDRRWHVLLLIILGLTIGAAGYSGGGIAKVRQTREILDLNHQLRDREQQLRDCRSDQARRETQLQKLLADARAASSATITQWAQTQSRPQAVSLRQLAAARAATAPGAGQPGSYLGQAKPQPAATIPNLVSTGRLSTVTRKINGKT